MTTMTLFQPLSLCVVWSTQEGKSLQQPDNAKDDWDDGANEDWVFNVVFWESWSEDYLTDSDKNLSWSWVYFCFESFPPSAVLPEIGFLQVRHILWTHAIIMQGMLWENDVTGLVTMRLRAALPPQEFAPDFFGRCNWAGLPKWGHGRGTIAMKCHFLERA